MLYSSTNTLELQYDSFDILSCYFYGRFYHNNVSIFSEAWNESFHDDPLFLFPFRVMYIYIFHFRSKMAHLPLRIDYCDQRRFWECSHISGVNCMIWTYYTSLEASEFSLSYHVIKIIIRSHETNSGAIWFCHIPFCPEVKGMPSFEWLKFQEGKTSGIPQKFQEFPSPFCLVSQKRMHDICMLLDARMILEWAFHSVNLTAAKRPK